jgi:hypothetical protein
MAEKLLTIPEATEHLRICPKTVRRRLSLRQIENVKPGKSVRISEIEIQRIISEGTMRRAAGRPDAPQGVTSDVDPPAAADVEQSSSHRSDSAVQVINAANQANCPKGPQPLAKTAPLASRRPNPSRPQPLTAPPNQGIPFRGQPPFRRPGSRPPSKLTPVSKIPGKGPKTL